MYNAQSYITRCLSALAAQNLQDSEVLLVDDASTDHTLKLAEALASDYGFRVIQRASNGGASAARNEGGRHAKGSILVFLDADIALAPDSLTRLLGYMSQHDEVCAVYTEDLQDSNFASHFQNLVSIYRHIKLDRKHPILLSFFMAITRDAFDKVGGYDEALPSYEDIELGHRLMGAGYRCAIADDLQVTHMKHYSCMSLLHEYFNKASTAGAYMLRHMGTARPKQDNCPRELKQAGLCLILCGLACLLQQWHVGLVFFVLYSFLILPMLRFLAGRKRLFFASEAYFMCLAVYITSLAALAYGVIHHKKCLNS